MQDLDLLNGLEQAYITVFLEVDSPPHHKVMKKGDVLSKKKGGVLSKKKAKQKGKVLNKSTQS